MISFDALVPGLLVLVLIGLFVGLRRNRQSGALLQAQIRQLTVDCVRMANTELQENREGRKALLSQIEHLRRAAEAAESDGAFAKLDTRHGDALALSADEALVRSILTKALHALPTSGYRVIPAAREDGGMAEVLLPLAPAPGQPTCSVPVKPLLGYAEWGRLLRSACSNDHAEREVCQDTMVDRLWEEVASLEAIARNPFPMAIVFLPTQELYEYFVQLPDLCAELQRESFVVLAGPESLASMVFAVDRAMRPDVREMEGGRPILRAVAGGR